MASMMGCISCGGMVEGAAAPDGQGTVFKCTSCGAWTELRHEPGDPEHWNPYGVTPQTASGALQAYEDVMARIDQKYAADRLIRESGGIPPGET